MPALPPALDSLPLINAHPAVETWLSYYWHKLTLPTEQLSFLAVTGDRNEFAVWTGRRLNPMALGCYCYLPVETEARRSDVLNYSEGSSTAYGRLFATPSGQLALPGFVPLDAEAAVAVGVLDRHGSGATPPGFRHLIFIEPALLPLSIEVTVAHELIHLADRVHGKPRKHRCHGHDSISVDEAAITERDPEELRALLREETARREDALRQIRPYRYLYVCPACGRQYRRVKKYARVVSCGNCDRQYNDAYQLLLYGLLDTAGNIERVVVRGA